MPDRKVWFGVGLGAWNGADVASAAESARLVVQADLDGLDLFTVSTGQKPPEAGRRRYLRLPAGSRS